MASMVDDCAARYVETECQVDGWPGEISGIAVSVAYGSA
jgi:hypothetical protein